MNEILKHYSNTIEHHKIDEHCSTCKKFKNNNLYKMFFKYDQDKEFVKKIEQHLEYNTYKSYFYDDVVDKTFMHILSLVFIEQSGKHYDIYFDIDSIRKL